MPIDTKQTDLSGITVVPARLPSLLKYFAVCLAFLAVSACGGGGGETTGESGIVNPQVAPQSDVSGEAWSNPATWGGAVPAAGAEVTIPAGKSVLLDTDIDVSGLSINGELICADRDLNVSAKWIMVHGLLQCGTARASYPCTVKNEPVG